jgi:hypothetical protein
MSVRFGGRIRTTGLWLSSAKGRVKMVADPESDDTSAGLMSSAAARPAVTLRRVAGRVRGGLRRRMRR